jgi:hypothetical protein
MRQAWLDLGRRRSYPVTKPCRPPRESDRETGFTRRLVAGRRACPSKCGRSPSVRRSLVPPVGVGNRWNEAPSAPRAARPTPWLRSRCCSVSRNAAARPDVDSPAGQRAKKRFRLSRVQHWELLERAGERAFGFLRSPSAVPESPMRPRPNNSDTPRTRTAGAGSGAHRGRRESGAAARGAKGEAARRLFLNPSTGLCSSRGFRCRRSADCVFVKLGRGVLFGLDAATRHTGGERARP